MAADIRIKNPEEVKQYLRQVEVALALHDEHLQKEKVLLISLGETLAQTQQTVNVRRYNLQLAVEQVIKDQNTDDASDALQQYQQLIEACDAQIRILNRCNDELLGLQTDYANIIKQSSTLMEHGQLVYKKSETLIDKIVEAL